MNKNVVIMAMFLASLPLSYCEADCPNTAKIDGCWSDWTTIGVVNFRSYTCPYCGPFTGYACLPGGAPDAPTSETFWTDGAGVSHYVQDGTCALDGKDGVVGLTTEECSPHE